MAITIGKIHTFSGHKDSIYTLTPYTDTQFFSSGADGMVVAWDLLRPGQGNLIAKVPASVYAIHFHPSKNILIIGQNFDGLHLIDMATKKTAGSLKLTKKEIFDIRADDEKLYIATGDGEFIVADWNLRVLDRQKLSDKSARAIAIGERFLAVGYSDQHIRTFDKVTGKLVHDFAAHALSVFTLVFDPEGKWLISGGRDAHLKRWDSGTFEPVEDISAHMYAINHITYSPDGQHFVTCSMDKSIKVWDSFTFKLKKVIDKARHAGHGTSVNKLIWMPYQDYLVSCSDDRTISVWDINFGESI